MSPARSHPAADCGFRACRRTGFTLIELLVAITVGGAILATTATLMARVSAANSATTDHLHAMQALGDLGRQFREDVHAAVTVATDPSERTRLALTLDDGSQVQYEGTSTGIARTQSTGIGPTRRARYSLVGFKLLGFQATTADHREIQMLLGRAARRGDESIVIGEFAITAVAPRQPSEARRPSEASP
ncbi:MAG: prepilin-type N-terminal cleavage/methylation domain-containing protein [Pirellulales bacterium]